MPNGSSPDKEITRGHRITEVWMFVAIDEDGDEGLPAVGGAMGVMPMVCTDRKLVDKLRATAALLAKKRKVRVELIRFGGARETLESWDP